MTYTILLFETRLITKLKHKMCSECTISHPYTGSTYECSLPWIYNYTTCNAGNINKQINDDKKIVKQTMYKLHPNKL